MSVTLTTFTRKATLNQRKWLFPDLGKNKWCLHGIFQLFSAPVFLRLHFSPFGFILLKAVCSQKSIMPAYKLLNLQTCKDRKASTFLPG
jgi:hypothetical protein